MGMRVLLATPAGLGHIHPMVPLARAIVARGHDVLWAAPADGVDRVERTGIRAVATGAAGLTHPADVRRRYPELDALPPAEMPDVMFAKMFGAIAAPSMLADLVPMALEWRPELVVADAAEFAGHIVAAELGVPSVTKGFGPLLPSGGWRPPARRWRTYGVRGDWNPGRTGVPTTPCTSTSTRPSSSPGRRPTSPAVSCCVPSATTGGSWTSTPLPLPDARSDAPLVYVTMGTVFNDPAPLRVVLGALDELDVRALVTVGPRADPAIVGSQPAHVRVERYVPQTLVLPHCDVVVSHAGSGTVLATLTLGLPQLCLPQGADQFLNAAAVSSSGAGISLMPDEVAADAIRDAIARLLGNASFRDASGRTSASIASMPSPDDVAAALETLP
jgi:UDP:flavonoid glycosyltransferase YjiC (YdhE family)